MSHAARQAAAAVLHPVTVLRATLELNSNACSTRLAIVRERARGIHSEQAQPCLLPTFPLILTFCHGGNFPDKGIRASTSTTSLLALASSFHCPPLRARLVILPTPPAPTYLVTWSHATVTCNG